MAKATWNGVVLAESDKYEIVEGNVYFPYECPWKGHADYYDIIIADKVNSDAAWSYPNPKPAAKQIKEHVAFERSMGVKIEM